MSRFCDHGRGSDKPPGFFCMKWHPGAQRGPAEEREDVGGGAATGGGAGRPLADRGLGTCGSPWAGPTHGPEHTAWDGEARLRGTETCRLTLPAPLAAGPKTRGSGAGKRSAGGEGTGRFGRGRRCVCRKPVACGQSMNPARPLGARRAGRQAGLRPAGDGGRLPSPAVGHTLGLWSPCTARPAGHVVRERQTFLNN